MDNNGSIKIALALYFLLVFGLLYLKPSFIFTEEGELKEFGTGEGKSMMPLWLIMCILGMISYLIVLVYIVL
jgi:hypothetical protein